MTTGTDREEIVRRFEALLDSALASEDPPAGIDAEIVEALMNDSPNSAGGPALPETAIRMRSGRP